MSWRRPQPDAASEVDEDGEPVAAAAENKPAGDLLLDKAVEAVKKRS